MALGAQRSYVRGLVVRQGLVLGGIGVAAGLALALAGSRLIESLLFGVSARDPLTYGAVAIALLAVAGLASWIPAQRAAGVDPAVALRQD
jgi:ABC-type antimicrobial peptide transport system permease subunit